MNSETDEEWIDVEELTNLTSSCLDYEFVSGDSKDNFLTSTQGGSIVNRITITPHEGISYTAQGLVLPTRLKSELGLAEKRILNNKKESYDEQVENVPTKVSSVDEEEEYEELRTLLDDTKQAGKRDLRIIHITLITSAILLITAASALWIWSQNQHTVIPPVSEKRNIHNSLDRINQSAQAKAMAVQYLSAKSVQEVLTLCPATPALQDLIRRHWSPQPDNALGKISLTKFITYDEQGHYIFLFRHTLPNGKVQLLPIIEDDHGSRYFDWQTFACQGETHIGEYKVSNTTHPVKLRGQLIPSNYYNGGYNERNWISFKLQHCEDAEQYLDCYLKRSSPLLTKLKEIANQGDFFDKRRGEYARTVIEVQKPSPASRFHEITAIGVEDEEFIKLSKLVSELP